MANNPFRFHFWHFELSKYQRWGSKKFFIGLIHYKQIANEWYVDGNNPADSFGEKWLGGLNIFFFCSAQVEAAEVCKKK